MKTAELTISKHADKRHKTLIINKKINVQANTEIRSKYGINK